MSAAAALKKKPAETSEQAGKAARPDADPVANVGMPAYLGGIAGGGGAPAFLQRAPLDGKPEIEEEEPLPDATIQRLPQDPFPAEDEEEELQDKAGAPVQAKLEINTPGDSFEQEADRVAAAVISGGPSAPVSKGSAAPPVQRKCASCGGDSEDGGTCPSCAAKVQRKESGSTTPKPTASVVQAVARPGSGSPIPDSTRAPIETELGQDLGHVRVHEGGDAAAAASSIGAKAFTHGNHIWLGPGQSSSDTALMAHEATHTVQQGSGGGTGPALVQRAPADYRHPEDGAAPQARIDGELESEREDQGERDEDEPVPEIDPAEKRAKAAPLESQAKPDTDRATQEAPGIAQAAGEVQAEVDSPSEPMVEGQSEAPDASSAEAAPPPAAADPVGEAVAQVASLPEPEAPEPVEAPPIAQPVDGDGNPLPPEAQAEAMVQATAAMLQVSREAAYGLRRKAKQQRANAIVLRGNLALVDQHVAEAETGLTTAHGHMEVRHEALSEADNAHATSEAKAQTVAAEAPGVQAQSEEAQGESGPMASEASDTAAQASANQSSDPDAAAEQQQNSGQMNSVAGDAASMDQATTGTQQRAVQLQDDAAQASEKNAEARATIDEARSSAEQTDAKLVEMDGQAEQARGELAPLTGTPDAAEAEAQRLDDAAAAADQRVDTMAARLLQVQDQYVSDMGRVPGSETLAEQNQGQAQGAIQRTEDPAAPAPAAAPAAAAPAFAPRGYEGRRKVELPTFSMGPPLTEAQRAEQAAAAARAEEARRNRIRAIQDGTYGNFNEMDGLDKAGLALDFMMQDAFASASNIKWPDFSAGSVGTALLNIIDPRGPLNGIMGGLSRVASGTLNLFDMDQWSRDPLGNLLKSAADIATGITVILGSIVALLGVAVAIMAAAIVLSWFTLAPALTPIIAWCTSTGITVGGWTIAVGKLALLFQGLLIIKNIVDVMTAETAEELVVNTEQLGSDFSQVGEIGMQMGTAYLAAKGGPGMLDDIATNGMRTVAQQEVLEGLKGAAIEVVTGPDISGVIGVARMAHGVHAHATGGGGGSTPRAEDGSAPRPADADAAPASPAPDAAPRTDAAAPEAPVVRDDGGAPPPDTPTPDAPTPNTDAPAAEVRPPAPVEGPPPEPSRPLDTTPPEPPQPRSDATGDSDASARTDPGEPTAAPTPSPTVDGGGAVARPDTPERVPTADAEGGRAPVGSDPATPRPDGESGPAPRPDGEGPATPRPDGETEGARPQEGSDPAAPRPDGEDPASLRESAGSKPMEDMSPAERRAEADQANSAPREDVTDPALRDAGFDDITRLDNDMAYIRSEEMGSACRISNNTCGPTDGDGTIPPEGLAGDPKLEAEVDAVLAGGDGTTPKTGGEDGPEANPPRGDSGEETAPPKNGTDGETDVNPPRDGAEESVVPKPEGEVEPATPKPEGEVEASTPKSPEDQVRETADAIARRIDEAKDTGNQDALIAELEALGYTVVRKGGGDTGPIARVDRPRGATETLPPVNVRGGTIVGVEGTTPRRIDVDPENMTPFTERYLRETGGRWGNAETRRQNYDISQALAGENCTFPERCGGGLGPEEFIPGIGDGSATFVDITAIDSTGRTVRVQTVDTTDGKTPTDRESAAADRIREAFPNDVLIIVPKGGRYPQDAIRIEPKGDE
ncbi:DUF4157 domain-containing protein [Erythrobacter sp. SDW2]|uniref:eCIS core domain-containing protein n=1 Tax=Erythrobacter sp. SDW2 TaxID=2907154 RepID=UPI001F1F6287|nr:DUF4157 domain-containing protein [Erythrobacter sp. SDW2]UIP07853.1 DUF4157 domain-containing protein [Erythrobacter sp. SDW2]